MFAQLLNKSEDLHINFPTVSVLGIILCIIKPFRITFDNIKIRFLITEMKIETHASKERIELDFPI